MSRQILKFETNIPITVALEFPDGVNIQGTYGPQVKFSLTDNRVMYLAPDVARAIKTLGVSPGEPFAITKRWEKGKRAWWDVEKVKSAGAEAILEPDPSDSPAQPHRIEPANPETARPGIRTDNPTRKTPQIEHGPIPSVPPRASGIQLTRTPPVKPSYEEAFRECLRIVTDGLAGAREQWSDGAKQAMVSTLLIQLGRENRLGEFRPQQIGKVA